MPLTEYQYTQADFPGGTCNPLRLQDEIRSSAIVTSLNRVGTSGGSYDLGVLSGTYTVSIWFNDTLSGGDETLLDGVVAAHDNSISNPPMVSASLAEAGVLDDPETFSQRRGGYFPTSLTTFNTVRATPYTPQGTDAQRSVSSTSANDTSAGTGARTLRITYYNAACQGPFTTDIALNGTTPVNTAATDIALIERIEVITVGSVGGNVGTIQLWTTTGGGGSVWASIAAGDNQTYWAHHYVATGKRCFITELDASGKPTPGIVTLNKLNPVDTSAAQHNLDISYAYGNGDSPPLAKRFAVPLTVVGPAIIFINARLDYDLVTSTTHAALGFFERNA